MPWETVSEDLREEITNNIKGLLFVICCLFAGSIHYGSKKYDYPYTVGCFLFGVAVGLIEVYSDIVKDFTEVAKANPHDILFTFLPVLIFESSFSMDAHMFYKALPQCVILAVVGFLFCTALTAAYSMYVLKVYNWNWLTAIVFGVIISATDPVAVVALLREMKMPLTFTVLIEGESLLNDGVAIVLYELITEHMKENRGFEVTSTLMELAKTCIGAPTLGYILGKMTEWLLIRIYISPVSEMTTTLVLAYVTYFMADRILGISAIVAVVLYGVTMSDNKMCISPESEALVHTDWRLLSIYANTLIFIIVGILVTVSVSKYFTALDALLILATYLALTFFRGIMIILFYPALKYTGYGLSWKESIILCWGGLRGAIGLALSLLLASNPHFQTNMGAKKVLIQTSGIIILTLIVNANSVKYLMRAINLREITLVNRLSMGNAIASVSEIKEKSLRTCKGEWRFMKADWEWVNKMTKVEDPYMGEDPNKPSLFVPYGTCKECMSTILPHAPSEKEMDKLQEAARKNVLRAIQGNLWTQFRKGHLQRRSLRALRAAIDYASDIPEMYLRTEEVKTKYMKVSRLNHWLETKLSCVIRKIKIKKTADFELKLLHQKISDFGGFRSFCLWIYFSKWFAPSIIVVVIANIVHISMEIYYLQSESEVYYTHILYHISIIFIFFYAIEIIIKTSALKWKLYIKFHWNKLDFAVSILAIVEGIIDVSLMQAASKHTLATHVRLLIFLRLCKYYYVVVSAFIAMLSFIRNHTSSEIYHAYDTGRGFLFATDAVLRSIDIIVDFGPCVKIPILVCEENIREMLSVLDEFENAYPAVAIAWKSNRAARRILNRVNIALESLKKRSLILQEDAREMKSILFIMTKKVVYAPKTRPFIQNIQKVIEEVDWINPHLAKDIYENHTIIPYDAGEVIQKSGEEHEYVFIIAQGILKVIGETPEEDKFFQDKLPNVDSLFYFQKPKGKSFHQYLTISQTIGLLGFLQKTPCLTTAVCEKECELIRIDYSLLDEAKGKYDDLIFCMWRSISMKIGLDLLKGQRYYEMYTDEDLYLQLEKGILLNLTESVSLNVPSVVEDTLIIQGRIKDLMTNVEYDGPEYIPRSSRQLKFLDDVTSRPIAIMLLLLKQPTFHSFTHWVGVDKIPDLFRSSRCLKEETSNQVSLMDGGLASRQKSYQADLSSKRRPSFRPTMSTIF